MVPTTGHRASATTVKFALKRFWADRLAAFGLGSDPVPAAAAL